jgi:hypothetical protein
MILHTWVVVLTTFVGYGGSPLHVLPQPQLVSDVVSVQFHMLSQCKAREAQVRDQWLETTDADRFIVRCIRIDSKDR